MDDLTTLPTQSLKDRINARAETIEGLESHIQRRQDLVSRHTQEINVLKAELARRRSAEKSSQTSN